MASRNANTRPVSWKRQTNEQLGQAVKEAKEISYKLAWIVSECHTAILTGRDNIGRMEGSKYFLRDYVFPYHEDVTPDEVDQAIRLLHKHLLIIHYQVKGIWYIQLPKIGKWSYIRGNMSEESDYPQPNEEDIVDWEERSNDVYTPCKRKLHVVPTEQEVKQEQEQETKTEVKQKHRGAKKPPPVDSSKKEKPKNHKTQEIQLLAYFGEAFKQHTGFTYPAAFKKDISLAKDIIKLYSLQTAFKLVDIMFREIKKGDWAKDKASFGVFKAKIPNYLCMLSKTNKALKQKVLHEQAKQRQIKNQTKINDPPNFKSRDDRPSVNLEINDLLNKTAEKMSV